MPDSPKFLIGYGERLTEPVPPPVGGGGAPPPYELRQARGRLAPQFVQASDIALRLPAEACPADRVVSVMTLHPSFVAKSHFPARLLRAAGFESVGSRPRHIMPELNMHQTSDPDGNRLYRARPGTESRPTTELFLESTRADLRSWARHLRDESEKLARDEEGIVVVEQYRMPSAGERSRVPATLPDEISLEVVLHAAGRTHYGFVLEAFEAFARTLGVDVDLDRRLAVGGLCFVPTQAPSSQLARLAQFSFLRVVRPMPRLRILEPIDTIPRAINGVEASLPEGPPIDPDLRVAVFDGGIRRHSSLGKWVAGRDAPDLGNPTDEYLDHGMSVTSALLFGSVDPGSEAPVPYAHVDHYRVLDDKSHEDPYELYDVIRRIESILDQRDYSFVNLSIGPSLPIEDDEVHSWTAFLDAQLADGRTLATVAVGNNGDLDRPSGNARIQVPSDSVNAVSVGAASSQYADWDRATYSALGPGRAPGIVKPDVLAFGGTPAEPFLMVGDAASVVASHGTSFASPSALRAAVGVRSLFGDRMDPLTLKALLIHTAQQRDGHDHHQHGWGRVRAELEPIVMCGDGVARVVYQGNLTPAKYLRAQLPVPSEALDGMVTITATLVFATAVEPEQPSNYTRSGLEVVFRPDETRFSSPTSMNAKSSSFFGQRSFVGGANLRSDAHKWETVLHQTQTKRGSSLSGPVFDIHYNARLGGHDGTPHAPKIRYAMVITVESKRTPDLYDRVLRTYATQLEALTPRVDMHLRVQV